MRQKIRQLLQRRPGRKQEPDHTLEEAIQNIPRITNETVAEHREEVLSGARKYIYPLQHSIHRIALISAIIFGVLVITFLAYSILALYKFNGSSTFLYRVTQVIPFPIAKAGPDFVAYENYLFELRHYQHYYQTQQKVDFSGESGKQQLAVFRKVALEQVIKNAYIKQLARQNNIQVSDKEVDQQISLLRNQNRLGSNDNVFEDVLKEFWDWSVDDFKRELKQQILAQKVVSKLDTGTHQRANDILAQIQGGGDFAALAKQFSDDTDTKDAGGDFGAAIERTNRDFSPQVVDALFALQPGQTSGIIETPLGLEIIKVREVEGNHVRASHIFFEFTSIDTYINPLKEKKPSHQFIHPN